MLDILYVGLGLAGFALLALYVIGCERLQAAMLDLILGGGVALLLLVYLVAALLRPERF